MKKFHELKLIGLVTILVLTLFFVSISFVEAQKEGKGKPKPEQLPLVLNDVNIVTAEPDRGGRLRVWGYNEPPSPPENMYENIWTAESVHHGSVAIGDVDGDDISEIAVPGSCKITIGKGRSRDSYYRIFINVYKEGISDVWKSTYYSDVDCIFEENNFWTNEITIADVDPYPGNEIVLITYHWLAVFYYNRDAQELKLIKKTDSFIAGKTLILMSVTTADIDEDPEEEILVSTRELGDSGIVENQGNVFIFLDSSLETPDKIDINAYLSDQSLRVGNLDSDIDLEICSTGYVKKNNGYFQAFIFVWDYNGQWILHPHEIFSYDLDDWPWVHLDVGDVRGDPLIDEIVVGSSNPDYLALYNYYASEPFACLDWINPEGSSYSVIINNVYIADADGDNQGIIIASGGGRTSERKSGSFYLEVFNENLETKWRRVGGKSGEYSIWYAAVGKREVQNQ